MGAAKEQSKPVPRWPWRTDFSGVSPVALRAARYALQMVARCPHLHRRLHDDGFLRQLWSLSFPLVDPEKLVQLRAHWNRSPEPGKPGDELLTPDAFLDTDRSLEHPPEEALLPQLAGARMREYLIARFVALPDSLLVALAAADGATPTHPSIALLGTSLGLSEAEQRVLDFVEKKESVPAFRRFLRQTDNPSLKEHLGCLAAALDVPAAEVQRASRRCSRRPRKRAQPASTRCSTGRPAVARRSSPAPLPRLPACKPSRSSRPMKTGTVSPAPGAWGPTGSRSGC